LHVLFCFVLVYIIIIIIYSYNNNSYFIHFHCQDGKGDRAAKSISEDGLEECRQVQAVEEPRWGVRRSYCILSAF
jgi:hypothetical protein